MTLFEITPELQKLAQPITPGWHPLEVTKIEDKPGDDGVKKTIFTLKIIGGTDKDKLLWVSVRHEPQSMNMNFAFLDFVSSGAFSAPIKPGDKNARRDLNMSNIVKQFDGQVINRDVDGTIMNNLRNIAKINTKSQQQAKA